MTASFEGYRTALGTVGAALLPNTWSPKLLQRLVSIDPRDVNMRTVREAYDGLPMRVAYAAAGPQIFSFARMGVPDGWHRGPVPEGLLDSPSTHLLSLCIAGPTDQGDVQLALHPGSTRRPLASAGTAMSPVTCLQLSPGDVAIVDSRIVRMWEKPSSVFELSVIRPWLEPVSDGRAFLRSDAPPRAQEFVGIKSCPTSLEEWLFVRHSPRPPRN